jgi:hypothetical protein
MTMRIAVLGAGVMGACLALFLARRGAHVVLVDEAARPLEGASRWNEGKIHLGYLYAADPSLASARRVLEGGLSFAPLMCELIGAKLPGMTAEDDLYLVHRDSVVSVTAAARYYDAVAALVRDHPHACDYLVDASSSWPRKLSETEIAAVADPATILAGYACPERSISTVRLADQLVAALQAEPRIELRTRTRVRAAMPTGADDGPWRYVSEGPSEPFDHIINALWHGRLAIDATAGLAPVQGWSHRYRVSAFVRTHRPIEYPSIIVAAGAFGDVKNYNDRDFYLSWYPAGLMAEGQAIEPPTLGVHTAHKTEIARAIEEGLASALPGVREIFAAAERVDIEGGYVFAMGEGSLMDTNASLHRRDRFGVTRRGRYISVDTGKYSSAPLLAREITAALHGD